jgi:disulfide bond formation protein DsbB
MRLGIGASAHHSPSDGGAVNRGEAPRAQRRPRGSVLVSHGGARYISDMRPATAPLEATQASRSAAPTGFARLALVLIALVSLGTLLAAFAGQYLFGLQPCILCLFQRVPYAVSLLIAGIGLAGWLGPRRTLPIIVCGGIFAVGAALAFYHVGVQEHWWGSIAGCGGGPVTGLTIDDLRADALITPLKPCDQVDERLLGLSLAGWNTIASALLAIGCFTTVSRLGRRAKA